MTSAKLSLRPDMPRTVQFYTSHPSLSCFPSSQMYLTSDTTNDISIKARSFSVKTQAILVNCVDVSTKELVYAWILRLLSSQPQVSQKFELFVRCGGENTQKFPYKNETAESSEFSFVSSNPEIIQVSPSFF